MKNTTGRWSARAARGSGVEVEDFLTCVSTTRRPSRRSLALARHAAVALRAAAQNRPSASTAHQHRHEHRVDVEGPETLADPEVLEMVGDVFGAVRGSLAGISVATPNVVSSFAARAGGPNQ